MQWVDTTDGLISALLKGNFLNSLPYYFLYVCLSSLIVHN